MAHRHHRVSAFGLIIWTLLYLMVGVGLAMKHKLAYWGGLIIAGLQIAPIVVYTIVPMHDAATPIPPWYWIPMSISAILGLALLIVLCLKQTRNHFFKQST